jgi:hypothetical protein
MSEDNFIYVAMCETSYARRLAFAFLGELKEILMKNTDKFQRETAITFSLHKYLGTHIKSKMEHFNSPAADRVWFYFILLHIKSFRLS